MLSKLLRILHYHVILSHLYSSEAFTVSNLSYLSLSRNSSKGTSYVTSRTLVASSTSNAIQNDFRIPTTIPDTSIPLSVNTLAGQIESAVIKKFGKESTQRIIDSWRLLDKEYQHREFISGATLVTNPNESNCWQYAHSYVPGLSCKTFWDIDEFEWTRKLSKRYKAIRDEFKAATKDMNRLQQDGNNIWAGALTDEAGGYGEGWRTLVLMNRGMWDPVNCNLFPNTAKYIRECGIPAVEVFFASMKPHSDIKLHSDFTNFVLTSHLAIDIPQSGSNKCRLSIGDDTRQWINGEITLFDTSIMHDAVNETDETRYILMFRLWHPDLTSVEKDALQFIYDCLEVPDLLSEVDSVRLAAERQVEQYRTFPVLKQKTEGFGGGSASSSSKKSKNTKKGRK